MKRLFWNQIVFIAVLFLIFGCGNPVFSQLSKVTDPAEYGKVLEPSAGKLTKLDGEKASIYQFIYVPPGKHTLTFNILYTSKIFCSGPQKGEEATAHYVEDVNGKSLVSFLVGEYDIDVTVRKGQKIALVYKDKPVCKNSIEDYYDVVVSEYTVSDYEIEDGDKPRYYFNVFLGSSRMTDFQVSDIRGIATNLEDPEAKFAPGAQIGMGVAVPITRNLSVRGELNYAFENPNVNWEYYFGIQSVEIAPRLVYAFRKTSPFQFYIFGGGEYNRILNITLKSDLSDRDEVHDLSETSSKNLFGFQYGVGWQSGPTALANSDLFAFIELGSSHTTTFLIDDIESAYKTFIAFKLGLGF